jgi:hypothetical protein
MNHAASSIMQIVILLVLGVSQAMLSFKVTTLNVWYAHFVLMNT